MICIMLRLIICLFNFLLKSFESLVDCYAFQNAAPQKGGEVNLTLGGIDLNNSGRLVCFLNFDGLCLISTREAAQQTNLVVLPYIFKCCCEK